MELSNTDYKVIENKDSEYFIIKARLYKNDEEYESAKEYYNLAVALGDEDALAELGEYYLEVEKNVSFAIAYLQMAAKTNNVLALYKLGYIYNNGNDVEEDKELGHYYYSKALDELNNYEDEEKIKYPSLHYEVAKDIIANNDSLEALFQAYDYLEIAHDGFVFALESGIDKYVDKVKEVVDLLDSDIFNEVREIKESDECEDDECHCGHCHE